MIKMIVAYDKNFAIGKNNKLPWTLPDDLRYFKEKTLNQNVLMGRKTFESILLYTKNKTLSNRNSFVLTQNKAWGYDDTMVFYDKSQVLEFSKNNDLWIIGGQKIYQLFSDVVDEIYATEVYAKISDTDAFFSVNLDSFAEVSRISHANDEKHKYSFDFVVYRRK